MTTSFSAKTVRVLIHLSSAGNAAVGVITSEWRGAVRLDRRLSGARPVAHRLAGAPRGVDPHVWLAYVALADILEAAERAEDSRPD